jgi:hypothetical protein
VGISAGAMRVLAPSDPLRPWMAAYLLYPCWVRVASPARPCSPLVERCRVAGHPPPLFSHSSLVAAAELTVYG